MRQSRDKTTSSSDWKDIILTGASTLTLDPAFRDLYRLVGIKDVLMGETPVTCAGVLLAVPSISESLNGEKRVERECADERVSELSSSNIGYGGVRRNGWPTAAGCLSCSDTSGSRKFEILPRESLFGLEGTGRSLPSPDPEDIEPFL